VWLQIFVLYWRPVCPFQGVRCHAGSPGQFARRYWSAVNAPVFGPDGRLALIAFCVEEVTDRLNRFMSALAADAEDDYPG
jgi:hypothetical protein